MAKQALVHQGLVVEVVGSAEDKFPCSNEMGWHQCPDHIDRGDTFDGDNFVDVSAAIDAEIAARPRMATANALIAALTDAEYALLQTGKPKDQARFMTRGIDMVPQTNAQVTRLAAKIGITPAAWFDRLQSGG